MPNYQVGYLNVFLCASVSSILNKNNNSFPYILRSNITNVYQVTFKECLTYRKLSVASITIIIIIGGYVKKQRRRG